MSGAQSLRRVCVFSGSSPGARPRYQQQAQALGELLARRGIGLVYGGASVGLMGTLANAALAGGGEVIGVIPEGLVNRESAHASLTHLHVVSSMHERKALMADLADAFIALPGGFGTLEELFEVVTWAYLGIHTKPIGLLNVESYYDPLLALVDQGVNEGFIRPSHSALLLVHSDPAHLLDELGVYRPPVAATPWMSREET